MEYVKIIPEMTSSNTPSPFVVSASSQLATYAPVYAFTSGASAWITDVANSYLEVDLGKPYRVEKVYFDSKNDWTGARVLTFKLFASNDRITWDLLEDRATSAAYDFEGTRAYGNYQYWRLMCRNMTMRGGAISQFQLFRSKFNGDYEFEEPEIMITEGGSGMVRGSIEPEVSANLIVKFNDNVVFTQDNITTKMDIEIPYSFIDFRIGANKIVIEMIDDNNTVTIVDFAVFRLSKIASIQQPATYQFKIKNSPLFPQNDSWVGQIYNFDYLNSEHGISYRFRYKPYAEIAARHEYRPSFADKVDTKMASHLFSNILSERIINGTTGITLDLKKADVSTIRKAVHWDGYRLGFEEAGLIQRTFDAWAIIDKEDVGIISRASMAIKRDKITKNMLNHSKRLGRRNRELENTLNLMNAHLTAAKEEHYGIINYYALFKDIHPYKDTIIALGYVIGASLEKLVHYSDTARISDLEDMIGINVGPTPSASIDMDVGVKGSLLNAERIESIQEGVSIYQQVAHRLEQYGHSYPHATLVNSTIGEGIIDSLLNASGYDRQGFKNELLNFDKDVQSRLVYLNTLLGMNKHMESKEGVLSNLLLIDDSDINANITHSDIKLELMPNNALINQTMSNVLLMGDEANLYSEDIIKVTKLSKSSLNTQVDMRYVDLTPIDVNNLSTGIRFLEKMGKDALVYDDDSVKIDVMPLDFNMYNDLFVVEKLGKDADELSSGFSFFDKMAKDMRVDTSVLFVYKTDSKEGFEIDSLMQVSNVPKDINVITLDSYTNLVPYDAFNFSTTLDFVDKTSKGSMLKEIDVLVDKVMHEVFKHEVLSNIDSIEKISMIKENWDFFTRVNEEAQLYEDAAVKFIKQEREGLEIHDKEALRKKKDTFITELLAFDYVSLDAYINQLAGNFERVDQFEAEQLLSILSDKDKIIAFIEESILTHRENAEKDAIIDEFPMLVEDESEWQDIWNRYSPGVDVLDPPDDDYDYSKLTPKVYDEVTGKPMHPIGATNTANIIVGMPLTHPIPENNEVGIDETKRIAVDNYIFIDTVLALESIKSRNKLRYAGMPAGKTIREVFSQLYTWIQQAAPGHEEYERMFRFARWYAEAVIIRQSKFILERVYNPWLSSLHTGAGLGTPIIAQAGWFYNTVSNTFDTTTAAAHLEFSKELMIDGQFILRGYFDNPLSHGTIEISVDGVVVDTFTSHGVFKREVEVPQGHHTFRIDFIGPGTSVSISTIEITGVQFISAKTVTDDSDTNGLKALNELMSQLLGYFELHHGGGKIKGTMEIRQRAVWNTHT